jgi:hypothetical protein
MLFSKMDNYEAVPFWNRRQNWKLIGSGVYPLRSAAATVITMPSSMTLDPSHLI